jgi:uncharacterized protein with von Willebrand factor type A (vWA) domain
VIQYLSSITVDWSGGTRIGDSIKDFNYSWARRVRCQGSIVMIISDGWDRGNLDLLEKEIRRLSRTSHRLIWLNPLAGSTDYQPVVKGIQTIMPHGQSQQSGVPRKDLSKFAIKPLRTGLTEI